MNLENKNAQSNRKINWFCVWLPFAMFPVPTLATGIGLGSALLVYISTFLILIGFVGLANCDWG